MRRDVIPALRRLPGYRSTSIAMNRSDGMVCVTTDWDTARDREGCDEVLAAVLKNAPQLELQPIKIELYEVAFLDVAST